MTEIVQWEELTEVHPYLAEFSSVYLNVASFKEENKARVGGETF